MTTSLSVPKTRDDITPEWMSEALAADEMASSDEIRLRYRASVAHG